MRRIYLCLLLFLVPLLASCAKEKQVYIIYFGEHKGDKALHEIEDHHHSYLQSVKESKEDAKSSLLYSYKHSINGFAAELTHDEASKLEKLKGVVSVFRSHPRKYKTHTTRSWEFVGLTDEGVSDFRSDGDDRYQNDYVNDRLRVGKKFLNKAKHGDGVIVGVIDSAWMTNDENKPIQDTNGLPANPFALGSGHFRPTKAADPGLVYDASYRAYLLYGCSVGFINIDPTFTCPRKIPPGYNLNYPSIAIPNLNRTITVKRTVTNVGNGNATSTYIFSVKSPLGVSVKAKPNVLSFNRIGQKKRFKIMITARKDKMINVTEKGQYQFGWFSWTDKYHVVKSPIAVSLA